MVFRTALALVAFASAAACTSSRPPAPAPKYATGPVPDQFSADELPEDCAPMLGRVNAKGPQRLPAWIDLARCVANSAIAQLELDDDAESVALLDEMTGPSFVLLDHVTQRADMPIKIAALHAKAQLYDRMRNEMLATEDRDERDELEPLLAPWDQRARAVRRTIIALGDAHPELSSHRLVRLAINDSERKLAVPVATRDD